MDEASWLACTDPQRMLEYLRTSGKLSERKARLFAVACCRRVLPLLGHGACRPPEQQARSRQAVEVAERFAEGLASLQELANAHGMAHLGNNLNPCLDAISPVRPGNSQYATPRLTELACRFVAAELPSQAAGLVEEFTRLAAYAVDGADLRPKHAPLWREVIGNPFHPATIDPAWQTWDGGTIPKLAQAIYDERELPEGTLELDRLAILADALEDAGCQDTELLGHLRSPGPHVRGCWAVDHVRSVD